MALYTMKEILKDAQEKKYGVGYFNAVNMEMTRAYISAAEACRSPIIIGTAEALLPYAAFEWLIPMMIEQAKRAAVPVAIHLDHTYNFSTLMQALRAGFGSIMYDGTRLPDHKDNVKNSAEIVKIAHAMGVGLECELGSVGGLSDESGKEDAVISFNVDYLPSLAEYSSKAWAMDYDRLKQMFEQWNGRVFQCIGELIDTFVDGDKTYVVMDVGDENQQLIILENRSSLTNPALGRRYTAYADVDGQHMYKSQYYPMLVARYMDLAT